MPIPNLLTVTDQGNVVTGLKCTACPLANNGSLKTNCMQGVGKPGATYFFVGHAPGVEDDLRGEPFTGANGRLFRELLQQASIDIDDCYLSNLIKCTTFNEEPQKKQWEACQHHLIEEIKRIKPKAIISIGAKAFNFLTGWSNLRKFKKSGIQTAFDKNLYVYPINQPAMLFHAQDRQEEDRLRTELVSDLIRLRHKALDGSLDRPEKLETDYQLAETVADVERFYKELEDEDLICFDFETCDANFDGALRPHLPGTDLNMIALSTGPGHGRAIPIRAKGIITDEWWTDEEREYARKLSHQFFSKPGRKFFGHNGVIFDQKWSRHKLGVQYLDIDFDTMLAHYLIDPDKMGHGLEALAVQYGRMEQWKPESIHKLLKDTRKCGIYACRDVDATYRVRIALERELNQKQQWLLTELLIPVSNEFMDLEDRGIAIHLENLNNYGAYLTQALKDYNKKIRSIPEVKKWELAHGKSFNPNSAQQVAEVMESYLKLPCIQRTNKGAYSTSIKVLEQLVDTHEFVKNLVFQRRIGKLKNTYYEPIKELTSDDYNLIHTSVKVHGTVTGRASSTSPNLFTIPRPDTVAKAGLDDPKIVKASYTTRDPHSRVLLQADYSQVELRGLAIASGDRAYIEAYRSGLDLHAATAAKVFGIPIDQVTKAQRTGAKKINFGIPYGMSEQGLIDAFVGEMRRLSIEEGKPFSNDDEEIARLTAIQFLETHKEEFPGIWRYMEEQKKIIRKYGYQETLFGRRRYYPKIDGAAFRAAMNFPIQSLASDFSLISCVRANKLLREFNLDALFVLMVYDSLIFDVAKKDLWSTIKVVKHVMENLDFDFINVPLVADIEVGSDLGHIYPVDIEKELILTEGK